MSKPANNPARNARYVFSVLLALAISVLGAFIGVGYEKALPNKTGFICISVVVVLLPILLFIINICVAKRFSNRFNRSKVVEMNDFMVGHRKDAEKAAREELKKLQHIRHLTAVYTVFLTVLACCIAALGGISICYDLPFHIFFVVYSWSILNLVFMRIHKKERVRLDGGTVIFEKQDYPHLYALAQKAADAVDCRREIVILPSWNCTASIIQDSKTAILQIGVILWEILSEQELYAILLHEFSHASEKNRISFRERQYHLWLCKDQETNTRADKIDAFLSRLYVGFGVHYAFHYMIYEYASSVIEELRADQAMAKYGNAEIAVSALLKTHYDTMHFWESGVKNTPSIFADEELKADYLTNKITEFRAAIRERSDFWNGLVGKEILANNASHPTLKMRMDALGVQTLALTESDSSAEYLAERQKALEFSEQAIYQDRKESYEQERRDCYLEPLARVEAWESAGRPIAAETYADLVSDLKMLGRHEDAEALCDQVISELPGLSSAHARFMKGAAMIYRYDERGMELIYSAMEQNGNYIEEGLNILGSFCCLTGRTEDLQEYRKKAGELAQKYSDQDAQITYLSKKDNLTKETLPDGMLEEILAFIKSVDQDIIQNVYLVRKTVSDTFFTSVFIIHFYGGTDAQRQEILHKIFRYLDSHPAQWQFSLFDYFEYPEIKVEKIEGSLVYSKDQNTPQKGE